MQHANQPKDRGERLTDSAIGARRQKIPRGREDGVANDIRGQVVTFRGSAQRDSDATGSRDIHQLFMSLASVHSPGFRGGFPGSSSSTLQKMSICLIIVGSCLRSAESEKPCWKIFFFLA